MLGIDDSKAQIGVMAESVRIWHRFFDFLKRLVREKPLGTAGAVILLVLLICAIFADFIAPYGQYEQDLANRLSAPSVEHLMGTDNLGRDLFSRIVFGARVSVYVGLGVSVLGIFVASIIGIVSGFFGGKVDIIIQRFVDAWMCFPPLLLILTVMTIVGPGMPQIIIVLGVLYGIGRSRVVRSAVISIKGNTYIEAAKAIGAPTPHTLIKHVLPNIAAPLIVLFTLNMGAAILAEATISFLGLGIPPPTPSWGAMLSGRAREYMIQAPWMALWPGVALALAVYSVNILGDALRDLLDPRLRGGLGRYSGTKYSKDKQKKGGILHAAIKMTGFWRNRVAD